MHKFNKYFLGQPVSNENHAGSKARKDVEQILQNNGWHKVCFINHFFYEKIKKMCKPLSSILFVCVNVLSFLKIKQKSILFIQMASFVCFITLMVQSEVIKIILSIFVGISLYYYFNFA